MHYVSDLQLAIVTLFGVVCGAAIPLFAMWMGGRK